MPFTFGDLEQDRDALQRFWMVYCPQGGPPTVRHPSKDIAEREARRLAAANRGKTFVVLTAVDAFFMPPDDARRIAIVDELPF